MATSRPRKISNHAEGAKRADDPESDRCDGKGCGEGDEKDEERDKVSSNPFPQVHGQDIKLGLVGRWSRL